MTSSWYSEPMWTSSTETAPCTTLVNGARPRSSSGGEYKGWPEAFPTGVYEMGGNLGEQRLGGSYRPAQLLFDPGQAFVEPGKVEQLPDVHY